MEIPSSKSRLVALLLVVFLGLFGAHRFYAGKTGSAVVQLVLTLTFIGMIVSGIWVFIDFIFVLVGAFTDSKGHKISDWNGSIQPTNLPAPGAADELAKYASLRDSGALTEEEYETKKKQLLG